MSARVVTSLALFVLTAVFGAAGAAAQTTPPPAKPAAKGAAPAQASPGAGPIIVIETEKGTIEFETYPNEAPKTVAHIVGLVNKRFYNGQRIHRVEPGFLIQMGDPNTRDMTKRDTWGQGGSGSAIGVAEMTKTRTNVRGAVAMAHRGDPKQADSQFYILMSAQPRLNAQYPVFGKVISGMDVVSRISAGDRIVRATVREAK